MKRVIDDGLEKTNDIVEKRGIKDAFLFYKENIKEPLKEKEYHTIADGFMKFIVEKVLDGNDVGLGSRLGIVGIRGKKVRPIINKDGEVKGVAPSWGKTKKMWIEKAEALGLSLKDYMATTPAKERGLVYCFNEHTNGIKYSIMWMARNVNVRNKSYYTLTFARRVKRAVMRAANEGREYLVLHDRVTEKELQQAKENAEKITEEIIGVKPKKLDTSWLD